MAAGFMQKLWVLNRLQVGRSRGNAWKESSFRKMNAEYIKSYFPAPFSGQTKCSHTNKRNLKCENDNPSYQKGTERNKYMER